MNATHWDSQEFARASSDFENLRLGQAFSGGERLVTADDLAGFTSLSGDRHPLHTVAAYAKTQGFAGPILHGPFGIAAFFGWFYELGLARASIVALLDTHWHYRKAIHVGDRLHFDMTIIRLRRSSSGMRGVVGRHVRIRNHNDDVVQEGTTSVLVHAQGGTARPERELFTRAWAEGLAARLNTHAAFQAATATWDGTFAIACDDDEIQFRVYKGRVLEAGQRSPNGPAFIVKAEEIVWVELFTGEENDLMKRAMKGQLSVSGSAYEYLRLTKALTALVDVVRGFYREGATS